MGQEAKHTPGPWGLGDGDEVYSVPGYKSVAMVCLHSEGKANARLIAAAPELLAAADEAFAFLGGVNGAVEVRASLLAALNKATAA
jgi:hypothetical protein